MIKYRLYRVTSRQIVIQGSLVVPMEQVGDSPQRSRET